jgi:hypothetical protein
MGEKMNTCRILVVNPEGKRPLGKPKHRWEKNIKMDLRGIGWYGLIDLAQDKDQWTALLNKLIYFPFP